MYKFLRKIFFLHKWSNPRSGYFFVVPISKNSRGFSLVETIVAMFAFSIIVSSVGTIYIEVLDLQRRGFGAQKVQENALFMLELMAREIRVSQITGPDSATCTATTLSVVHPVNGNITYTYVAANKKIQRTQAGFSPDDISSSEVEVNRLNFCVTGSGVTDNQSVRVGIVMQIQNKSNKAKNTVVFDVQTTVTSRDISAEF